MVGFIIFLIIVFIAHQVGLWLLFKKAGENPVLSLIPVYNYYILTKISNRPWWWVLLLFVPIVQFITNYNIRTDTIKNFGKFRFIDEVLGVMFFSFYVVYLGWDKNTKYIGPCNTEDFKKKHAIKKTTVRDWSEALFFAAVVATQVRAAYIEAYTIPTASMERSLLIGDFLFVSKTHYGVRIPMTPVAFPFAHHTMPLIGGKAYTDLVKFPYYRFPAIEEIDNNDIVVFNFPEGDTVITVNLRTESQSYYQLLRDEQAKYGPTHTDKDAIRRNYLQRNKHTVRPLDKKDNYIKRCVAIGGDSIEVRDAKVYINGKPLPEAKDLAHTYIVNFVRRPRKEKLAEMGISVDETNYFGNRMSLTGEALKTLKDKNIIDSAVQYKLEKGMADPGTFPSHPLYNWNKDHFGPLWVPKKGATITLTKENYPLYERVIRVYEHNDEFTVSNGKFILNGEEVTTYTFKQDYYFMMGDNRDNSLDSRFWGFVPFDHVVGKPVFIWLSLDYEQKGLFNKIRWERLFSIIDFD
ncbi:MAG: signal peptidase I [bacterium]